MQYAHPFSSTVYPTLTLLDPILATAGQRFSVTYLGCEYTTGITYKKEKCPKELKLIYNSVTNETTKTLNLPARRQSCAPSNKSRSYYNFSICHRQFRVLMNKLNEGHLGKDADWTSWAPQAFWHCGSGESSGSRHYISQLSVPPYLSLLHPAAKILSARRQRVALQETSHWIRVGWLVYLSFAKHALQPRPLFFLYLFPN